MMFRRSFVSGLGALAISGCSGAEKPVSGTRDRPADDVLREALATIEREAGGRLGAFVLDTGDGRGVGHRAGERFYQGGSTDARAAENGDRQATVLLP